MCLAEHIYYINCGCWEGRHIRWQCPRGSPHGAGACPEVVCSGVFRKWGRCLVCQRRQAQKRRQQQHVLTTGSADGGHATRDARRESVFSRRPGRPSGTEWHRRFD
ncbi:hypothetical protein LZ31DRAFT_447792, partial [Colletotrichum somersetense]